MDSLAVGWVRNLRNKAEHARVGHLTPFTCMSMYTHTPRSHTQVETPHTHTDMYIHHSHILHTHPSLIHTSTNTPHIYTHVHTLLTHTPHTHTHKYKHPTHIRTCTYTTYTHTHQILSHQVKILEFKTAGICLFSMCRVIIRLEIAERGLVS